MRRRLTAGWTFLSGQLELPALAGKGVGAIFLLASRSARVIVDADMETAASCEALIKFGRISLPTPRWFLLVLGMILLGLSGASGQAERKRINMEYVEQLALEACQKPFAPAEGEALLPANLRGLTPERYRHIRFLPEKEFWKAEGLPFGVALFHLGHQFTQPVAIHEFTADYVQPVRFSREFFDYKGANIEGVLPADLGYAGFRISHPLNNPKRYDEMAVFQGASYYRILAKGQNYGMSARGLAIDSGIDGVKEEFPVFTHFWLGKPQPGAASVTFFALLNSPSATGAYQFVLQPGKNTVADVDATLFFRREVKHLGVAPLTSMFWFGENTTKPFDDYRPEVHDSDGLVIKGESGECLWRPLRNDPEGNRSYTFSFANVRGFGLVQRDRSPRSYEDFQACYHDRPGVWVEPKGDWGAGVIRLVELASRSGLSDNIVAAWEPAAPPALGKAYRVSYRQTWTFEGNPAGAGSWVVATRTGVREGAGDHRTVVLEWAGPTLERLAKEAAPEAVVTLAGEDAELAGPPRVERSPGTPNWRVAFEIRKKKADLPASGAEVRCTLRLGNDYLSETWTSWLSLK